MTLRTDQNVPLGPDVPLFGYGKRGSWTQVLLPTTSFAAAWLGGLIANLEEKDDVVTALETLAKPYGPEKCGISAEYAPMVRPHLFRTSTACWMIQKTI